MFLFFSHFVHLFFFRKCSFHPLWVRSFCHSSRRSGSQASLPCRRQSSFIDVIFSGIIQSGHVCPNCWLQLELCSLHGVAAPPHALPRAARPVHAHHTLCVSRARLLWVVTPFQATTTLLVSHKETVSFFSALSAPLCGSFTAPYSRTPRLAPPTPLRGRRFTVGALALRSRYFTTTWSAV